MNHIKIIHCNHLFIRNATKIPNHVIRGAVSRLFSSSPSDDNNTGTDANKSKQDDNRNLNTKSSTTMLPFDRPRTKAAARMQTMMLKRQGRLHQQHSSAPSSSSSYNHTTNYSIQPNNTIFTSECGTRRILYQRNSSNHFPKFLLAGTTLHGGYWLWYLTDFTNTLQNAGMQISAPLGYIGFGLSAMMLAAASLYPVHLISEVSVMNNTSVAKKGKGGGDSGCVVKVHTLPFGQVEQYGGTYYPRGQLTFGNVRDEEKFKSEDELKVKGAGHIAVAASDKKLYLLLDTKHARVQDVDALRRLLTGKLVQ